MYKKKIMNLSLIFLMISILLLAFVSNPVNASYERLSNDWEDLFDGQTSNVGQYFWMNETSNQIFEIDDGDESTAMMGDNYIWIEYINSMD
ncbi:unnamed protein product, partial [marine sediment metagenome]